MSNVISSVLSKAMTNAHSIVANIIREDVQALHSYAVPDAQGFIKLDAMENPYTLPPELAQALALKLVDTQINRYPVPSYGALKSSLIQHFQIPVGYEVILGNGSDELIAIISQACAKKGAKFLAPVPSFVMYAMSAKLADVEFVGVPLQADLSLDMPAMLAAISQHKPAVTYLAYPNNPTGNLFNIADIELIIHAVGESGIVVLDEAYQPFAQTSMMSRLAEFPNMIVMRTVSKLGMAGIRLGYMSGAKILLDEFDKVRPPYNVNVLTETAALFLLEHTALFEQQAAQLRDERSKLSSQLAAMEGVEVFPSAANFLLIRVTQVNNLEKNPHFSDEVFTKLLEQKILVKNVGKMHALLQNCLRITVSTPEENLLFLNALSKAL